MQGASSAEISAIAASLVSLAFCMSTFERWLARRSRHQLAWSVSLAMFTVAAAALAYGASGGWSGATFRVFYLFGAILDVPFLALGTVYLLVAASGRHPVAADRAAAGLCLGAAFAVGVVLVAPFTHPLPAHRLAQGSQVFGILPRVLAAVASAGGAIVVVAGAAWSALRSRAARTVAGSSLIALGTLVTGASGLLNSAADQMTAFAVTLTVGIAVIFSGFLVSAAPVGATGKEPTLALSAAADAEASQSPPEAAQRRRRPPSGTCSGPGAPGRSPGAPDR